MASARLALWARRRGGDAAVELKIDAAVSFLNNTLCELTLQRYSDKNPHGLFFKNRC
jgi:hypothetical protein